MAWLNLTMPNQTVKNGLKTKKIKLPQMNYFLQKQETFSCTYYSLSFCKILKELLQLIQQAQDGPFVLNKFFLVQTIIIFFIYLLALFIVQNLQKIATADPKLWGCTIFGPKMVHLPKTIFFSENYYITFI